MKRFLLRFFFSILLLIYFNANASSYKEGIVENGFTPSYYRDGSNQATIKQIINQKFKPIKSEIFNFGLDTATFWIKMTRQSEKIFTDNILFIDQSRLKLAEMYVLKKDNVIQIDPHNSSLYTNNKLSQGKIFKLPTSLNKDDVIFLRLRATETFLAPVSIRSEGSLLSTFSLRGIIFGFYTGIMAIMFVYNLFLFIIIRDKSYLYYIFYIMFTWLTQISIQGYSSDYFWQSGSTIDNYSVVLFSSLTLVFTSLFTLSFLNTRVFSKNWHKLITIFFYLTLVNLVILAVFGIYAAFAIMQILTVTGTILALSAANFVYFKRHFKPAGYYLVAWSVLLIGAILFIMKDYEFIPYNNFTIYLLQIASAIEVMLLSFALADKINFFKKENEVAQAQALNASLENQKLIREQNIVLEKKVKERTEELVTKNKELEISNYELQQFASVASHDLQEPLRKIQIYCSIIKDRFLSADPEGLNNMNRVMLATKRMRELIDDLLDYSRLSINSFFKKSDIGELVSEIIGDLELPIKEKDAIINVGPMPEIEVIPGQIRQVFQNLLINSLKFSKADQRPEINISAQIFKADQDDKNDYCRIEVSDNGIGFEEKYVDKIFAIFQRLNPREAYAGTGIGLAIVKKIIEKHNGTITAKSQEGIGSTFIMTLPVTQISTSNQ